MGRNAEQNRLLREAQYAAILACALDLFVSRGFAATRVADIAGAAGISPGLLYHYFPGKDDILVALLQNALPRLEDAARELEALSAPAADKIRAALRLSIQGMVENSENGRYHLLLVQLAASDVLPDAARALIDAHAQTPYRTMQRIFAQGQREGSVRAGDPRQLAMLFWALVKGLAIHHAIHGAALGEARAETIAPLFLIQP